MKLFKATFLLAYCAVTAVAHAETKPCLKIGVLGEFNRAMGSFSQPFGKEILRGTELAKEKFDKPGNCIDLVRIDIGNSIANIDGYIRKAAKEGIHLFVGLGTSDQATAARSALADTKSILITPTASSETLTATPSRTVLLFPTNPEIATSIAREIHARGVGSVLTVFAARNSYSEEMRDSFRNAFEALGGHVADVPVRSGHIDLSESIAEIKATPHGHIFLPLFELDAAKVIAELSRREIFATYVGTDSWGTYSPVIKNLLQNSALSAFVPQIYDPRAKFPLNQWFVSAYRKKFQADPTDLAAFSFDGVQLAKRVAHRCRNLTDSAIIQKCISEIHGMSTTMGPLKISSRLSGTRPFSIKYIDLGKSQRP